MSRVSELSGRPVAVTFESLEGRHVANSVVNRPKRHAFILSIAVAVVMASASLAFAGLSDPGYQEGFGNSATGGAGQPTCTVTSSAASGPGTFDACFTTNIGGNAGIRNKIIQFAVSS